MEFINFIANEIRAFDISLFWTIHLQLRSHLLDIIMPFFSHPFRFWKYLGILIALGLLLFGGKRARIGIIMLILAVGLSDLICSHVLKELFHRLRPYDSLRGIPLGKVRSYAFPSSHAANVSAFASMLFFYKRRFFYPAVLIALFVGYSRIYTGSHYPLDVLGGFFLGTSITILLVLIKNDFSRRFFAGKNQPEIDDGANISVTQTSK
jgi:undecaprenyl-diphosphatase